MSSYVAVGSGLAGLAFALRVAESGHRVTVLTKAQVAEANTSYAQGGIAAAVGEADSWKLHEQDTLTAGAGLCDPAAVRFLVQHAPDAIDWLKAVGTRFDTEADGDLALGREGGHSRHRIVHFADRTGWEIERAVVQAVREHPSIEVIEHAFATALLVKNGVCHGVRAVVSELGERTYLAHGTLIATGGGGMMYQHTTNPRVATADGIGLASDAGAAIADMEFMQFHPTTLYHPQLRSFLITEAVRGAGATLRNHEGRRFMYDYDPRLELAPRDVVARAMEAEMQRLGTWCLYLDLTHLDPEKIEHEFPTIYAKLMELGLDIRKEWIPVVPAQHYSCGGIVTDLGGRSSIRGLYAAGEVARTGVHGANRLASNSLLEAVVFSQAAALSAMADPVEPESLEVAEPQSVAESEAVRIRHALQSIMTQRVAVVRSNEGLKQAESTVESLIEAYRAGLKAPFSQYALETRNLLLAARHVVQGARARTENVGLHYNVDLDKE
ncbi:MAG: L-aspartate oxidase [Methanoregulaceae archaeon]|nr:L-aspartate oxidase [Methanoregulaceae archaeon]